ncbi:MAG: hypothetical protein RJB38_1308 [Pseudomonadota bacterium]|jgi:hypothetical protein
MSFVAKTSGSKRFWASFVASVLLPHAVWAKPDPVTSGLGRSLVRSESEPAESQWQASLGMSSLTYLAQPGSLTQSQFSILRFNGRYFRVGSELEWRADARIGWGLNCGELCSSVEFPELAVGSSRRLGPVQFQVGRVLLPWSALDDEWKLGVFQPRFIYDFLHPQQVGLAGAFVTLGKPGMRLSLFASPGFVPDRGLPVSVDNGRITSIDPFFHAPISEVIYEGKTTPIAYHLNRPPLTDLLMRPGWGFLGQWGEAEGWSVSGAYAYKPVNQVLLAYNNLYNLSFEVADADLYPRVVNHHLMSADLKYAASVWGAGLSVVREIPVMDQVPVAWNSQQLAPAWLVSPQVSFQGARAFRASVSYLSVQGGNALDSKASSGPQVNSSASVFNLRYPFTHAVRASIGDQIWKKAQHSLTWKSQMIFDLEHSAQAYLHSVAYQPHESWQVRLATDILVGSGSQTDFISRNRANDRFFGAVSYVF